MMLVAALSSAMLMAGPFTRPGTVAPAVTKSAAQAEAQRQLDYLLEVRISEQERVYNIGDRILRANAELCPQTHARLGIRTATVHAFSSKLRDAAARRWSLGDTIRITSISPGSAAEAAGLRPADEIVSLQGQPVASGKKADALWEKQLDTVLDKKPAAVVLGIRRGGEARELELKPDLVCGYDMVLDSEATELNAYADGRRIVITRPILKLAANDSELALVIAHEIAHNARRHINAKRKNAAVGLLGGALLDVAAAAAGVDTQGAFMRAGSDIGAGMYSPEFETEADYVGLYFMTRALRHRRRGELLAQDGRRGSPGDLYQEHAPADGRAVSGDCGGSQRNRHERRRAGEPDAEREGWRAESGWG